MRSAQKSRTIQQRGRSNNSPNIYVNEDGARIVMEVLSDRFTLRNVSDPATITFDKPVRYSVITSDSVVSVRGNDDKISIYKKLVGKEGKYVTVIDDNDNEITRTFKEIVDTSDNREYEVTIHTPLENQELYISYINPEISWYPKITINLDNKNLAHISYSAVLNNKKGEMEGNYFVSTLERTNKISRYAVKSRVNAIPLASTYKETSEENGEDSDEVDSSVTLSLGLLSFKDILVRPNEYDSIEYSNLTFVDINFYDNSDSSSQICQEGIKFIAPFYFPASRATISRDSFFLNTDLKTHHKGQQFYTRLFKSKQVRYSTTHTENYVIDKQKYAKNLDFNKYDLVSHVWKVSFKNSGPTTQCLITISGVGDIIDSFPQPIEGLEQRGSLRISCNVKAQTSSFVTITVVKKQRKPGKIMGSYFPN